MVSRRTFLQSSSAATLAALAGCSALPFVGDGDEADESDESALVTSSNVHPQAGFGSTVALDGETLLVGAQHALNRGGEFGGTAFVYEREDDEWVKEARLRPPGEDIAPPTSEDARLSFGSYVAAADGTAVVGTADAPAAYLYERASDGWHRQARLYPDTVDTQFRRCNSLSFDGETLAMSTLCRGEEDTPAIETVHVFAQRDGDWREVASLQHGDTRRWDRFGYAVAVADGTLVVGSSEAPAADIAARQSVVRVYQRTDTGWTERAVLRPESEYTFGGGRADRSIDVAGDTLVVGDLLAAEEPNPSRTLVYRRSEDGWRRQATLRPDSLTEANFGAPLALRSDTLVAAAAGADVDTDVRGSAFRYERDGQWSMERRLSDREVVRPGQFGFDVVLSEDRIAVGGRMRRDDVADQEAVYVFPR
jgi:hypothetical protein